MAAGAGTGAWLVRCSIFNGIRYEELGDYEKAYKLWTQLADSLEQRGFESEIALPHTQAQKCKKQLAG